MSLTVTLLPPTALSDLTELNIDLTDLISDLTANSYQLLTSLLTSLPTILAEHFDSSSYG